MSQDTPHTPVRTEPLSLAVHTLPDLTDPRFVDAPPSGRGKLLAIMLVCSLPVFLAYLIFFTIKPTGQPGFGELIHPARAMPTLTLSDARGHAVALDSLKNQWLLVSVGASTCDDDCAKRLFIQRQLRQMLNKDKDRVDRLWLVLDEGPVPERLLPLLQDTQVLRATPQLLEQWLGRDALDASQRLFIVDPQGNAMLSLPAEQNNAQVHAALRVLQKLLSASTVWDKPGR